MADEALRDKGPHTSLLTEVIGLPRYDRLYTLYEMWQLSIPQRVVKPYIVRANR